ncbi:MAG: YbhB/YbcL family Raf kinase inhibitor-like protein [Usitatibacter sp.]
MNKELLAATTLAFAASFSLSGCENTALAQSPPSTAFTLSSPDLAGAAFTTKFILNGFGCAGQNVSPALVWTNPPAGTKSFALQVYDPDAPTGSGFWHWALYDIPPTVTGLAQGAANNASTLPPGSYGGNTDFFDTGTTGGNGLYGGPCPPAGDPPHRYNFTLYALSVDHVDVAAGIPRSGTAGLFSFALNKGIGTALLGKASFTATYGR